MHHKVTPQGVYSIDETAAANRLHYCRVRQVGTFYSNYLTVGEGGTSLFLPFFAVCVYCLVQNMDHYHEHHHHDLFEIHDPIPEVIHWSETHCLGCAHTVMQWVRCKSHRGDYELEVCWSSVISICCRCVWVWVWVWVVYTHAFPHLIQTQAPRNKQISLN